VTVIPLADKREGVLIFVPVLGAVQAFRRVRGFDGLLYWRREDWKSYAVMPRPKDTQ
jgi:hypothetical protein